MKTQLKPWIFAGAFLLGVPCIGHAQETLGGLGAAGAAGATLGAAGAGGLSAGRIAGGLSSGAGGMGSSGELGRPGAMGGSSGSGATAGGAGTASQFQSTPFPPIQTFSGGSGQSFVRELMSSGSGGNPSVPRGGGYRKLFPRAIAAMTKKQRTRLVQAKYKIPPRGWLAAYLPQDRYKLGKDWRFVSTEDDHFYYTPASMGYRRFNPNRVIGFSSWREAMLAGYRPDPSSKPAPSPAIISYANALRSKLSIPKADLPEDSTDVQSFYNFVELIYAGQVDEDVANQTLSYTKTVFDTLAYVPTTRWRAKKASIMGLEAVLMQRATSDIPVVAGSRAFEARLIKDKGRIESEVAENNEKIDALAFPLAENLAYRPGTIGRDAYEYRKAKWEIEHTTPYYDAEVRNAMYTARIIVQGRTGMRMRNANAEITTMMNKIVASALRVNLKGKRQAPKTGTGGGRSYMFVSGGNWINHYIPVDRDRIRGGLWRYVSTDLDNNFYLPNDARMLRQPADRVIGFNSFNAAIEAGYNPAEGGGIDISKDVTSAKLAAKVAAKQRAEAAKAANSTAGAPAAGGRPTGAPSTGAAPAPVPTP